jgi:Leucine-rich repeat (LRR) protein
MRYVMLILILGLFLLPTLAQDESSLTPYEIALQRIEVARVNEATSLYLGFMGLTELPPEIGNLTNLQRLNIFNNQLSRLPPEIGSLTNLQSLDVSGNRLSILPSQIGNLSNLQFLDIGHNQLSDLPSEIGNLSRLQTLFIYYNQLTSLESEISKLSNLANLDLSGNQLDSLPSEISELESLCYLSLRDNHFQFLSLELIQLEGEDCKDYGRHLNIDGNPLISPPPEVIAQGTDAILDYLRNEAWWHLQRLIVSGAGAVGLLAAGVLGLRWKNRRGYEKKKKG